MADAEREDSYYFPGGVPVTPQARRFGYEFPVYVSKDVWRRQCIAEGIASKHGENLEKRIWHVLQSCYDGMAKKLAVSEDFIYYEFKIWYWVRDQPNRTKKWKEKLGARLMLNPSTGDPWLYIFNPEFDTIDDLERGEAPRQDPDGTIHPLADGEIALDEAPAQLGADSQSEPSHEEHTLGQDSLSETPEDESPDRAIDLSCKPQETSDA